MTKLDKEFIESFLKNSSPKAGFEVNGIDTDYKKLIDAELTLANIKRDSVDLNSLGVNLSDLNKFLFKISSIYLTFNFFGLPENIQELIKNLINNFPISKLSQIYFTMDADEPWYPSYNKNLSDSESKFMDDDLDEDFDFVDVPSCVSTPVREENFVNVDAVSNTGEVEVSSANSSTHVIGLLLHAPKPLSNLKVILPQSPSRDLTIEDELSQNPLTNSFLNQAIHNLTYAKSKLAEAVAAKNIENINKYTAAVARGKNHLTEIEFSLGIASTATPELSDSRSSPSKLKASERQLENELHKSIDFTYPEVVLTKANYQRRLQILQKSAALVKDKKSQNSMLSLNELIKERKKLSLEELQARTNEKYLSMSCPDLLYANTNSNKAVQKDLSQSVCIPELRI